MTSRVLLVLALAASGCSLLAPPPQDTAAIRESVNALERGINLWEKAHRENLDVIEDGWLRAISAEVNQAVKDDLRRLEKEGKIDRDSVDALYASAEAKKATNLAAARTTVTKARDLAIIKDVREVFAALRAWVQARCTRDEQMATVLTTLEAAGQRIGVTKEGE
jgi:hypothetical protein